MTNVGNAESPKSDGFFNGKREGTKTQTFREGVPSGAETQDNWLADAGDSERRSEAGCTSVEKTTN